MKKKEKPNRHTTVRNKSKGRENQEQRNKENWTEGQIGPAKEAKKGEEQRHQSRSSCPGITSCKAHPRGSTDKLTCNPYGGVSLGPPSVIVRWSSARLCLLSPWPCLSGVRTPLFLLILFGFCFKLQISQTSLNVKFGPCLVINRSLNTRFITSEIFPQNEKLQIPNKRQFRAASRQCHSIHKHKPLISCN